MFTQLLASLVLLEAAVSALAPVHGSDLGREAPLHTRRSLKSRQRASNARKNPIGAQEAAKLRQFNNVTSPNYLQSATATNVTWQTTPFNPPAIPLAVRSPYVSTYLWGGNHDRLGDLATQFASFWNGNSLPWCGTVMVDGMVYTWMGVAANCAPAGREASQLSLSFTATRSTFVLRAGGIDLTANFLSPVTPNDLVRQSLPYSYLAINVVANDGAAHDIKLYTDITAEWASNDWERDVTWSQQTLNSSLLVHQVGLTNPLVYGEAADSTLYGQVVYATDMSANTTFQSGPSSTIRQAFNTNGQLDNSQDTQYRKISDRQPAFGYAKSLGSIAAGSTGTALFAVGHYRDPAFSYTAVNVTHPDRSLYFMSAYPSLESSLGFFYNDYDTAMSLSSNFDTQVDSDATSYVSAHYADICALVARQVWSGTEITIGQNANGTGYNTSDVMIFQKEIATSNYVNTVDVMSPAWPFFAYTNPDMLAWMLRPVIEYSEQVFPHQWAPHDIGTAYPNATGANQVDAPYYIEESANMLFMSLAYTRFSGKTDLISNHYAIHKKWADFLSNSSLYPALQASSDDFYGELANMTSLAVKGAVGLACMGALAELVNNTADATSYTSLAKQNANVIAQAALASTSDHLKLTYQSDDTTWSSLYNLMPDKVFGLNVFPDSFYAMQAAWYGKEAEAYGVPLDSRGQGIKSDFALWMAAAYNDNATLRDTFVDGVWNFLNYGQTGQAVPDFYNAQNATAYAFVNRPVMGGAYASLAMGKLRGALNSSNTTNLVPSAVPSSAKRSIKSTFRLW